MSVKHSEEFNRDTVRIALTNELTRRLVTSDLSIGLLIFGRRVACMIGFSFTIRHTPQSGWLRLLKTAL